MSLSELEKCRGFLKLYLIFLGSTGPSEASAYSTSEGQGAQLLGEAGINQSVHNPSLANCMLFTSKCPFLAFVLKPERRISTMFSQWVKEYNEG